MCFKFIKSQYIYSIGSLCFATTVAVAKVFWELHQCAEAEEQYGLPCHAMAINDRATKAVHSEQQLDMYRLCVKKVEIFFVVTKSTRGPSATSATWTLRRCAWSAHRAPSAVQQQQCG